MNISSIEFKTMVATLLMLTLSTPSRSFSPSAPSIRLSSLAFGSSYNMHTSRSSTVLGFSSSTVQEKENHLHIHFGAGNLGIGLILPSLEEGDKSYVVVQRSNPSWELAAIRGSIDFTVNKIPVAKNICVINDLDGTQNFLNKSGRQRALALTSNGDVLMALCENAKSFSVSLGSAITTLIPTLSRLPNREEKDRPFLYACENNHEAAKEVGKALSEKVNLCCCMVDRICTKRDFKEGIVDVSAEEEFQGLLVPLEHSGEKSIVPFGGPTVLLPNNARESHYFYDRKVSLVNGMHTCLAFMTLREEGESSKDYQLVTYATANEKLRSELRAWAAVRCLMLLEEYGTDTIKAAHGIETDEEVINALLDYSWEALNRFSKITDTTSRVLGGGVGNRWATRLWPVSTFAKWKYVDPTSLGAQLMTKAGVTPAFAQECCDRLVRDGMQSCAKEMQDCAKRLVQYYKKDNQASFPDRKLSVTNFPEPEKLYY